MEHPKAPAWPELEEQPAVEWPEALSLLAANHEPVRPGRDVPATAPVSGFAEPYRDPRKPPPVRTIEPVPTASDLRAERAVGRILPVIEAPVPVAPVLAEEHAPVKAPAARAKRTKLVHAEGVAEVSTDDQSVQAVADELVTATETVERQSAKRLHRDELKRAERWKARLPIAVFKRTRRKRIAP